MSLAAQAAADKQWSDFLLRWPLESLSELTLEQYTQAGDSNTFTYWLEVATEELGSIWGGSAFKFGIYSRKDKSPKAGDQHTRYSTDYAWVSKYGDSAESAFARVKASFSILLRHPDVVIWRRLTRPILALSPSGSWPFVPGSRKADGSAGVSRGLIALGQWHGQTGYSRADACGFDG